MYYSTRAERTTIPDRIATSELAREWAARLENPHIPQAPRVPAFRDMPEKEESALALTAPAVIIGGGLAIIFASALSAPKKP